MGEVCREAALIILTLCFMACYADSQKQGYVVYMGSTMGAAKSYLKSTHLNMLASAVGSFKVARSSLLYSYTHSINGFSAILSKEEAEVIASMAGVVSVFPSRMHKLHTTRSWDFLDWDSDVAVGRKESTLQDEAGDVIIGLLDTGVWPESESFNDEGMGPIPPKWKGTCVTASDFNSSNCNRKLIGARYYVEGASVSMKFEKNFPIYEGPYEDLNDFASSDISYQSTRDSLGHGSHTATTAGGRLVENASFYGLAEGTARGGAPFSRIAAYKVCSEDGCSDIDILAAYDDAIKDGVDVLSISLGTSSEFPPDLLTDGIAIGAFHAMHNGILVVCSAGNEGPSAHTVVNSAPWIMTVGASTLDRFFNSKVVLGNNITYEGQAVNYFSLSQDLYPIVYGGDIPKDSNTSAAGRCVSDSVDATKAKGKIVLCFQEENEVENRVYKSIALQDAGAAGMIIADDTNKFHPSLYDWAATQVSKKDGMDIFAYIKSASNASATILRSETEIHFKPSPVIAQFSARGPNKLTENILKPDITAPGVNILAGWTMKDPFSDPPAGEKPSPYAILSGTSMACPHVSGAGAFLKSVQPNWSPSVIKSALMTTATSLNNKKEHISNDTGYPATWFDLGAGELDPMKALDPGLVYQSDPSEHFLFLCYFGYNQTQIATIAGNKSFVCPADSTSDLISNLNYPSIAIAALNGSKSVVRTLTNVGPVNSTYKATVALPPGVDVKVTPDELVFSETQKSIRVNVTMKVIRNPAASIVENYVFGSLVFSDVNHTVTTPIVVKPIAM